MWLHFATSVWECNELERWLYSALPATKIAQSPALGIYKAWRKWLKTAGIPKFFLVPVYDKKTGSYREVESKESADTYYAEDDRFDIENPSKEGVFRSKRLSPYLFIPPKLRFFVNPLLLTLCEFCETSNFRKML